MNFSISGIKQIWNDISIEKKINVICMLLVIGPVLVLGFVAYNSVVAAQYNDMESNLGLHTDSVHEATEAVYSNVETKLSGDLNILERIVKEKGAITLTDGKLTAGNYNLFNDTKIVDEMQTLVGDAATIFRKDGDKAVRVSTNIISNDGKRAIGTTLSQEVYDKVIGKGETYVGQAKILDENYLTAYKPLKDNSGSIIGALFVGVDQNQTFADLEEKINQRVLGSTGYVYVLASDGETLISKSKKGCNDSNLPFIHEIITTKNGFIKYQYNGLNRAAKYTYFEPLDWIIVATVEPEDYANYVDQVRNAIIIVIILGIIAGAIISRLFGRYIIKRMNNLIDLADHVTAGDLSKANATSDAKDEIGTLARSFNEVVATFEKFKNEIQNISLAISKGRLDERGDTEKFQGDYASIIGGVNNIVDIMAMPLKEGMVLSKKYADGDFTARFDDSLKLEGHFAEYKDALNTIGTDISVVIAEIMNELATLNSVAGNISGFVQKAAEEVTVAEKSIDDVSNGTAQVAQIAESVSHLADVSGSTTKQIDGAMQDLLNTVADVANNMNGVTNLTGNALELLDNGKIVAGKAETGMHNILESSGKIETMITDINSQMIEIVRIVDIISSISEQTNLLALNAAIEAARAGDAGLGFAVVAGEVKDLATGSQKSAENIASIIDNLQKKTVMISDAVKMSLEEVTTGTEAVRETLTVFNDVVGSMEEINKNMNDVAAASEEQTASVEEITATVSSFGEMVKDTAKEATNLAAASEESSAGVGQILEMVSTVETSMNEISDVVGRAYDSAAKITEKTEKFKI